MSQTQLKLDMNDLRTQNLMAHAIVEAYYWGMSEAIKTNRNIMSDMVNDNLKDSPDYRDAEITDALFDRYGDEIEKAADSLVETIRQNVIRAILYPQPQG